MCVLGRTGPQTVPRNQGIAGSNVSQDVDMEKIVDLTTETLHVSRQCAVTNFFPLPLENPRNSSSPALLILAVSFALW